MADIDDYTLEIALISAAIGEAPTDVHRYNKDVPLIYAGTTA